MIGYADAGYAASLSEYGTPRFLAHSRAWILERAVPGTLYRDAMGCYPIFACEDWSQLARDLEQLSESLICLSVVTDPFGLYDLEHLRQCFPDLAVPFKQHFVIDLKRAPETFVLPHHRRNARQGLRNLQVEKYEHPAECLDDWSKLYQGLVDRHHISGIAKFSLSSFAKQLEVPGMIVFRAIHERTIEGMLLCYEQDNRVYYHLGAFSPRGYELRASFALFDHAIRYFAEHGFEWFSLGAGAGVAQDLESGLSRFKQGWSTGTRTTYFCGRIFDREKYREMVLAKGAFTTKYFPAYREGEFN